MNHFEN